MPVAGLPSASRHSLVLLAELESIHLFIDEELGITDVLHFHPPHHLADDHFDVLVVDVDTLEPVDLLDLVHQVLLQLLLAQDRQDVVRVPRAVHQGFAGLDGFSFLHGDVDAARQQVFFRLATLRYHDDLALTLDQVGVFDGPVDFRDDRRFVRFTRFKQFHHARQVHP